MTRRLILGVLLFLITLSGCRPQITVSSDPQDLDLSAFAPEIVRGPGFTIEPDVRVFTLFAFLNGPAGWSDENKEAFSPQRQQLRDDMQRTLAALDPKTVQRWRDFYERHKQISYRYLYYTMTLGAPPDFHYIVPLEAITYPDIVSSLDGFNHILADFYQQAGIEALYESTYREMMMEEIRKYDQERILEQTAYIYSYLHLDRAAYETFAVMIVPAPFNSYWDANALNYTKQLVIVEGPEANDYGLNMHEYLHMLMDELIPADFAGQKSKLDRIFRANRNAPYVKSYQSLHVYVEENLVRALDHRMRARIDPTVAQREARILQDEVANGLVLEEPFYQALAQLEQDPNLDVRAFIGQLLQSVSE